MTTLQPGTDLKPDAADTSAEAGRPMPYLPGQWREVTEPPRAALPVSASGNGVTPYIGVSPEHESDITTSAQDLRPRRLRLAHLLCFLLTFLIYIAWVPRFLLYSSPPTGDQPFYLMDVISIAQDGDINIKNNYDNFDFDKFYNLAPHPPGFMGISAPYPLPQQLAVATARPPEEWYNAHPPGLPILLVPAWIVGSWFSLWWPATVVFMCFIGALVSVNAFLLAHEMTGRLWIAYAVWIPVAFSNPVMSYSYLLFTELTIGLLLIYVFRRLAFGWGSNGPWRLLLMGMCIGYMPWIAPRSLPLVAALGLYGVVQWWRYRRYRRSSANTNSISTGRVEDDATERRNKGSILSFVWFLLPVVVGGASLVGYNFFLYGQIASTHIDPGHGFNWPWGGIEPLTKFVNATFGLLFDQQFGLLPYAPVYLLAVVGAIAMFRSRRKADRRLLLWGAVCMLPYMVIVAAFTGWSGIWSPPARYFTTFVPLLAAPLAMSLLALSASWAYRAVYAALALPSLFFMAMMVYNAHLMWVTERGALFKWLAENPESPIRVDLLQFLPAFTWPIGLKQPLLVGWMSVASFLIVLVFYLQMSRRSAVLNEHRLPRVVQGSVWLGALGLIGAGWFLTSVEYLGPKITLVEQRRWQLVPSPVRSYGITYLEGKVYVTDYGYQDRLGAEAGGTVGELDLNTGLYKLIAPVSATGVLTFLHPGDIKASPDGLLYVLNNGLGDQALYVMQPDGQVRKQLQLDSKTGIATGLSLGLDGSIYISDMFGGGVAKYGPDGGPALATFRGPKGGLNNPTGVVVAGDGTVYTNEGHGPILKFSPNGELLREYQLKCQPIHMLLSGDWLDITCGSLGLVSINMKNDELRLGAFDGGNSKPNFATGLAYGPNNTLYMLDGSSLIEYNVQR